MWGIIFKRRRGRSVVLCLSIFDAGGSVRGCICVYLHKHTHIAHMWGVQYEPKGRDETPEGPEESRWTKSRQICIRIFVQSAFVYTYAVGRDESRVFIEK